MAKFITVTAGNDQSILVNLDQVQTIEKLNDTNKLKTKIRFAAGDNRYLEVKEDFDHVIELLKAN